MGFEAAPTAARRGKFRSYAGKHARRVKVRVFEKLGRHPGVARRVDPR
jgi:hypothetical protein